MLILIYFIFNCLRLNVYFETLIKMLNIKIYFSIIIVMNYYN